jgi:hypothetical protein
VFEVPKQCPKAGILARHCDNRIYHIDIAVTREYYSTNQSFFCQYQKVESYSDGYLHKEYIYIFHNMIVVHCRKIKVWDLAAALDPRSPPGTLCIRTLMVSTLGSMHTSTLCFAARSNYLSML